MADIVKYVNISCPVDKVYNQYTQFEEFPKFMSDVTSVRQLDDKRLHWVMDIAGVRREFHTEITEQIPEKRIAWKSLDGPEQSGVVTFHRLSDGETRVTLQLTYDAEGFAENVASGLGVVDYRVRQELENFKQFIETRGRETGTWRGEIPAPHERS